MRLPVLGAAAFIAFTAPAFPGGEAEAVARGWAWWKGLSEDMRKQVAPKLLGYAGKAIGGADLTVATVDNLGRYRAICGRRTGAFRQTSMCRGLQFRFGERSAWSTVFLGIYRRAGVETAPARDAAALLAGLRKELGLASAGRPAQPQHLVAGLYDQFGHCSPPACQAGLADRSELKTLLTAAAGMMASQGNDGEVAAARILAGLGWQ